ncbi:hypothetical protein ILYODFUR_005059 [Ilyodon furcidens]|uniref:Secreted protein n=1 Tax=Ilyodon furcidens TaxID=33524 RepID=A0ABV0T6E8_9TELE
MKEKQARTGCTVAWLVALLSCSKKVLGSTPSRGCFCMFSLCMGVFSPGVCMVVCVLPCDGLATCPGCSLPTAHRLLEISSFPATHYGRSGIEMRVCF